MNDDVEQSSPEPAESPVDPAILEAAKAALQARGSQAQRMTVMAYPPVLFNDLLERLADRRNPGDQVLEWLILECQARELEVPSRPAFYRFRTLVRQEYRLAALASARRQAQAVVAAAADGSQDAMQMALNMRVTELLTDEFERAQDAGQIETKRLTALMVGSRMVAQTAFDKQKMDSRIEALETQVRHREKTIELLQQRVAKLPEQVKTIGEKLDQVEKAQAAGKKIDPGVFAAIRAELTRVKEAA